MSNAIGDAESFVEGDLEPVVRESWDPEDEPASSAVVRAVAEAEGTTSLHLERPLYDAVDPDALDRLFAARSGDSTGLLGQLHFRYHDYTVLVHDFGRVDVYSPDVDLTTVVDDAPYRR